MKLSKELKIGFISVVTIALCIWGFNFLKGINILKNTRTYYVVYEKVGGILESAPVMIRGFQVGLVDDIRFINDYSYNIKLPFLFDEQHPYFSNKICVYPWHGVYINEKSDVAYCCQLPHEARIGNMRNGYNFNSKKMLSWRKLLMDYKLPMDCRFCHRRFKGHYTKFYTAKKKWKVLDPFK